MRAAHSRRVPKPWLNNSCASFTRRSVAMPGHARCRRKRRLVSLPLSGRHHGRALVVTTTASQAAWRPHEAQVLAGLWRSARLTVLYGESREATTALLRSGVLPLLRSEPAAEPPREVVIDLDDWSQPPLPALQARLSEAVPEATADAGASLAERLRGLHEREDVHCLFLFDRFEDCLEAPPGEPDPAESVLPPAWRDSGAPAPAATAALPDAEAPRLPPALPSAAARRWRTYAIATAAMLPLLLAAWMLGERSARPPAAEPGTEPV